MKNTNLRPSRKGSANLRTFIKNVYFNAFILPAFRLRDGMSLHYRNWGNCTMFVEDLNATGKNITAEIPKEHAIHFKEMCKLFASINSNEQNRAIDEYVSKIQSANTTNGSTHRIVDEVPAECSSQNSNSNRNPRIIEKETLVARPLPSSIENRQKFEYEIFTIVVQFIHDLDPAMKLFPFGSTQYGIKYSNANFNLLVTTGEFL